MRDIDSAAEDTLSTGLVTAAYLVEMELTETLRLATTPHDIEFDGETYIAGNLVDIQPVKDTQGTEALQFSLSGANGSLVTIARGEPIKGKAIRLREAFFDPATHELLDAPIVWAGTLDQMPIKVGADDGVSATIGVTAQHRGVTFARPKPLRYTDADQQRLHPGDTCMRFINSQAGQRLVWPAASYFRT
jgi:hypothetical protein